MSSVYRNGVDVSTDYWLYLILCLVALFLSSFYSAAETAFQKYNKFRFKVDASSGKKVAKAVLWVSHHFDSSLTTILIGNNLVNVALSYMFTIIFIRLMPLPEGVSSLLASIVLTLIVYLFGETIPKQVAGKIPNRIASICVYPLIVFIFVLYPLTLLFQGIAFIVKKLFHSNKQPEMTEEDFTSVVEKNEKGGLLEKNESDLIQASIDFSDTSVKDVLTSHSAMFEIDLKGLSNEGLVKIVCQSKYSRIPVYYQNRDKIVGILLVKQYLAAYLDNHLVNFLEYIEKPYIVSPSIKIDDLIDGFREKKTQIALVMSNGKLLGMVTMEDVLEELVGPIGERYSVPRMVKP